MTRLASVASSCVLGLIAVSCNITLDSEPDVDAETGQLAQAATAPARAAAACPRLHRTLYKRR